MDRLFGVGEIRISMDQPLASVLLCFKLDSFPKQLENIGDSNGIYTLLHLWGADENQADDKK
jgi:hypothetical protein